MIYSCSVQENYLRSFVPAGEMSFLARINLHMTRIEKYALSSGLSILMGRLAPLLLQLQIRSQSTNTTAWREFKPEEEWVAETGSSAHCACPSPLKQIWANCSAISNL